MTTCSGCQYLMQSRWGVWCHKAHAPLLAVRECPSPRERMFYEPMDLLYVVRKAQEVSE